MEEDTWKEEYYKREKMHRDLEFTEDPSILLPEEDEIIANLLCE